jgi:hypothetical protein
MIYLLQILCFLFAVVSGYHDAPACDNFSDNGSSNKQQAVFHGNNWKMKTIVVLLSVCIPIYFRLWTVGVILAVINGSIIWLVFDIALNLKRSGRSWNYLSESNGVDRWLLNHFGKNGGEVKAVACSVLIAVLNVTLFHLNYLTAVVKNL